MKLMKTFNRTKTQFADRPGSGLFRRCATALLCWVLLATAPAAFAQRIVAEVDRKQANSNETINLTVMTDQHVSRDAIDFTVLEQDFEILSFRPTSRTQVVNGQSSAQTTWQLELAPLRSGKMIIPEFTLNAIKTNPIAITITQAKDGGAQTTPLLAIVEFNKEEAFVNEQIYFTLKITAEATVSHIQGGPSLDDSSAEITLVTKNDYKKAIDGKQFDIIERVYAIFASRPGTIEVPSGTYRGWLKVKPTRSNNFQRAQPVVARTRPLKIEIKDPAADPRASTQSPWFPARGVAVSSAWTGDKSAMRVGEPITRTIRVEAIGQRAAAIPPISYQSEDFKQYAEQPVLKDEKVDGNVVGVRTDAVAIVPSKAGQLTLPPVAVNWWDVVDGVWRTATLPAETINVAPVTSTAPAPAAVTPAVTPLPVTPPAAPALNWLTTTLAIVSAVLAAMCLWLFTQLRALRANPSKPGVATSAPVDESGEWRELMAALKSQQPEPIRRMLIRWADAAIPERGIKRLGEIGDLSGDENLQLSLKSLDSALYRNASAVQPQIDYAKLREQLEQLRTAARSGALSSSSPDKTALPQLYLAHGS